MQRRTTALTAAALALLPLGQPLLLSTLGIATATTAVVLHQGAAIAQDASAVARIAEAITVRIEGATQGSGVIVKKEGSSYTVLTAWHVVSSSRPGEELGITTPDGKQHPLDQGSIQRLGQVDMAVLTFNSPGAYEVASVGDVKKVKFDDPVYVAGFPINNSQMLRYETGDVVANAEVGIDQGYQLLYDNQTFAGMSGGALLNSDGELVGLHGRGESSEQSSVGETQIIKTGVNQGVPIIFYSIHESGSPVVLTSNEPTTSDDYLAIARASEGISGREQTVIRLVDQALKLRRSNLGYLLRANAKLALGDKQAAINAYDKALLIDPNLTSAFTNRGTAKAELGDYKGALQDFNKALNIYPNFAQAFYNRGLLKGKALKKPKEAILDFNKALKINPTFARAYNARGYAKLLLGDQQGAIVDYHNAFDINPLVLSKDGKVLLGTFYYNEANSIRQQGNLVGSLRLYTQSLNFNKSERAYVNRGIVYKNLGRNKDAILDYSYALNINPLNPITLFNRGNARYSTGDVHLACNDYKKAASLKLSPAVKWLNSNSGAWCRNM